MTTIILCAIALVLVAVFLSVFFHYRKDVKSFDESLEKWQVKEEAKTYFESLPLSIRRKLARTPYEKREPILQRAVNRNSGDLTGWITHPAFYSAFNDCVEKFSQTAESYSFLENTVSHVAHSFHDIFSSDSSDWGGSYDSSSSSSSSNND